MEIDHLSLNADGCLLKARAFYTDFLQLRLINDQRPAAFHEIIPGDWYELGSSRLHVFDYPVGGPYREPNQPTPGGPHVAFRVPDLAPMIQRLESYGISYRSMGEGRMRQIWFLDPAGNTIEINTGHAKK
ncbi:VOC family protein [Phenylobacterium sp.]|uniref:VOC family protein n=1 Tax=Phenylobacterium sp. TaxID=1871053 RepID=UPI002811EB38|nr:VOC family protein [Phenylobacterium sp.]